MRNRGFTLVELLAVIIILGVLAIITIPPIMRNVEKVEEQSFETLVSNIEQTTQIYIRLHKEDIPGLTTVGNTVKIKIQDLIDNGILKGPLTDQRVGKDIAYSTDINILVKPKNKYDISLGTIVYVNE